MEENGQEGVAQAKKGLKALPADGRMRGHRRINPESGPDTCVDFRTKREEKSGMNPQPRYAKRSLNSPVPLIILTIFAALGQAHAGMDAELSAAEQKKLARGETVVQTIERRGATWPEVRIYKKIRATPEDVTALFLDYPNAKSYIDNLESAVVEKTPDPQTKDVRYTVRLPVIGGISYLVRNRYEKTQNGSVVKWTLLEPPFAAKAATGSLRVEQGANGDGSVICYANHVEPATRLLSRLSGLAVKEAAHTVEAIVKEAEKRDRKSP